MNNNISPSQKVYNFIKEGNKIEAIKILREETGMSLKEAKEFIENIQSKKPLNNSETGISERVIEELRKGSKIEAIKIIREETGAGLKDSKEIVEKIIDENPEVKKEMDEINKQKGKKAGIYLLVIILVAVLFYILIVT